MDPRPWPEGSYELGSVHPSVLLSFFLSFRPSVLLSRSFLGIGSLVFSETQHDVKCPCSVVCDKVGFLGENNLPQKWGKWAKNRVF